MNYSVLMSVYHKENPEYLRAAIDSILCQTVKPAQVVLVCDGPLTPELDDIINGFGNKLEVLRLDENMGLGKAKGLNAAPASLSQEWTPTTSACPTAVKNSLQRLKETKVLHC